MALSYALVLSGCNGGAVQQPPPSKTLQTINVTPQNVSIPVGSTQQFKATGNYSDGSTQDLTASAAWSSSSANVATISSTGLATGVGAGSTTIAAASSQVNGSTGFNVTVPPPNVADFNPKSATIGTLINVTGSNFSPTAGVVPQVQLSSQGGGTINAPLSSFNSTAMAFVVPDGAATGPLTVTVGTQSVTSSSPLTITAASSFTIVAAPGTATLIPGQTTTFQVGLTSQNGFAQLAALSISGLPTGVTASFAPAQLGAGQSSTLTITAPAGQAVASASLTISAQATVQGIPQSSTANVTLNVASGGLAFIGRVAVTDPSTEVPLVGVTVTMLGKNYSGTVTGCTGSTTTDASGNFALTNLSGSCVGSQMVTYDPSTVTVPPGQYSGVTLSYTLAAGQVNSPGIVIHLPRVDNAETVQVAQNSSSDQTFSFKSIPNLTITVYAGTTFSLADGTQPNPFLLRVVEIPYERLPDQMPPDPTQDPVYAMSIEPFNSSSNHPIAINYPNRANNLPGTTMPLTYLNPTLGVMVNYGTGTVSADGTQIIPDSDAANPGHHYGVSHFDWGVPLPPPPLPGPGPGPCDSCPCPAGGGPNCGGPIDIASGVDIVRSTDLVLNNPRGSVRIERVYTTANPSKAGPFGNGSSHNFNYQLSLVGTGLLQLLTPEGNQYSFPLQPNGTYTNSTIPPMQGAVISSGAAGTYNLRWKNGTVYQFNLPAPGDLIAFLSSITDANGNAITLTRTPGHPFQISQITDPAGRALVLSYDSADRVTSITDPLDRTLQYIYNSQGALTSFIDAAGGVTKYEFNVFGYLTKITDPRGVVTEQNFYDSHNRVSQQTQADGGIIKLNYTLANPAVGTGPVIYTVVTDPLGNSTTYHFSTQGFLLDVTDALGQKRIFTRAPGTNLLLAMTGNGVCATCGDPRAGDISFSYDANGNELTTTDALGHTYSYTYEPVFNQLTSVTDPLGNVEKYAFDSNGNLASSTDANGNVTSYSHSSGGLLTQTVDALGDTRKYFYDTVGNLIQSVDALGNTGTASYDPVSRRVRITDARGIQTEFAYDNLDRVSSVANGQGNRSLYVYDAVGNLTSFTNERGNRDTFTYDGLNRQLTRVTPLGKTESRTFDLGGNVTRFVDRRGQTSQFVYDNLNRLTAATYQDGASVSRKYDGFSRIANINDSSSGTFDFTYNAAGLLISVSGPNGAIAYSYDLASRLALRQVVGQPALSYAYDAADNLTGAAFPSAAVNYSYDGANRLTKLMRSNGVSSQYTYDAADRLTSLVHGTASATLVAQNYIYDALGRRSFAESPIAQPLATSASTAAFDAANRILSNGATTYSSDDNGNVVSAAGSAGTTTYKWDSRNRLTTISSSNGQTTKLSYDFGGNLISQVDSGPTNLTRNFIPDLLGNVAYVSRSDGDSFSVLSGQTIDDHQAVLHSSGLVEYGLLDALGSTTATADGTGAIKTRFFYEPFGQSTPSGPTTYPFQFAGRTPIGPLIYMRARYFDPGTGRFVSEDPLGISSDSNNLFEYVGNSPVNDVDPTGLKPLAPDPNNPDQPDLVPIKRHKKPRPKRKPAKPKPCPKPAPGPPEPKPPKLEPLPPPVCEGGSTAISGPCFNPDGTTKG